MGLVADKSRVPYPSGSCGTTWLRKAQLKRERSRLRKASTFHSPSAMESAIMQRLELRDTHRNGSID